jgi:hypothetical protein
MIDGVPVHPQHENEFASRCWEPVRLLIGTRGVVETALAAKSAGELMTKSPGGFDPIATGDSTSYGCGAVFF